MSCGRHIDPPETIEGKGSIASWVTYMSKYLQNVSDHQAVNIAISFLAYWAHKQWIFLKDSKPFLLTKTWPNLKAALNLRFDLF